MARSQDSKLRGTERVCVSVRPNKNGACQCVEYAGKGTVAARKASPFRELCSRAGLPVVIAGRRLDGADGGGSQAMPDTDMQYPLAVLEDDLAGFGQIVDREMVTSLLIGTGTSAGGILLSAAVWQRIEEAREKRATEAGEEFEPMSPAVKGLSTAALGLVGGGLLWRVNRDAAMGLASGMAGFGIASAIGGAVETSVSLSQAPGVSPEDERLLGVRRRRRGGGRRLKQPMVTTPEAQFEGARGGRRALKQPIVNPAEEEVLLGIDKPGVSSFVS